MIVSLLLAIISSALFSSVLAADVLDYDEETGQLKQTSYAALLEELRGAHLRIAATNVSPKLYYFILRYSLLYKTTNLADYAVIRYNDNSKES